MTPEPVSGQNDVMEMTNERDVEAVREALPHREKCYPVGDHYACVLECPHIAFDKLLRDFYTLRGALRVIRDWNPAEAPFYDLQADARSALVEIGENG